jgi:hypothetical protein
VHGCCQGSVSPSSRSLPASEHRPTDPLHDFSVSSALGAFKVIAIDINAERLAFAKSYAATDIFQPSPPQANEKRMDFSRRSTQEMIAALGLQERGFGAVNVVIEASGAEPCIQMGYVFLLSPRPMGHNKGSVS